MTENNTLHLKQKFDNVNSLKEFIKTYNEQNFTNFVVETNNKRSVVLVCKHGVQRNSKSRGQRANQRYNYLGCEAKVRIYKTQKGDEAGTLNVTSVNLDHNHDTSKQIFESEHVNFTDEEKELIITLKAANTKPSQITKVLWERSKKRVTIQKLKNLIRKISPHSNEDIDHDTLEKFLEDTEIKGGEIYWMDDKDGKMKALFISSKKMKSAF